MKLDIERLERFAREGRLQQGDWGDAHETACALSASVGVTSDEQCVAAGWPLWLAVLYREMFDGAPDLETGTAWALEVGRAIKSKDRPDTDWGRVKRDLRLRAVLPIAMESVGKGDESWRVACRNAVQWSMDNDGANPYAHRAASAAEAARVAWAERAARAAGGEWAAGAAWAAEAAWCAWGAGGAGAAWFRVKNTLVEILTE